MGARRAGVASSPQYVILATAPRSMPSAEITSYKADFTGLILPWKPDSCWLADISGAFLRASGGNCVRLKLGYFSFAGLLILLPLSEVDCE